MQVITRAAGCLGGREGNDSSVGCTGGGVPECESGIDSREGCVCDVGCVIRGRGQCSSSGGESAIIEYGGSDSFSLNDFSLIDKLTVSSPVKEGTVTFFLSYIEPVFVDLSLIW